MKTIAYVRVSTDKQDVASQKLSIKDYADYKNITIDKWVEVEMSSRKSRDKRKIDELLTTLKRWDRLIVPELSRLSRTIFGIHDIVNRLDKKKIEYHIVKENLINLGKDKSINFIASMGMFATLAEVERSLISQRTKAGLKAARARGVKLGNPHIYKLAANRKKKALAYAQNQRAIVTGLIKQGLTQRQIMDELNKAGILTRKGNQWTLQPVQLLLKRLNLKTKHTRK